MPAPPKLQGSGSIAASQAQGSLSPSLSLLKSSAAPPRHADRALSDVTQGTATAYRATLQQTTPSYLFSC